MGSNGRLKLLVGSKWHNCDLRVYGLGPIQYVRFVTDRGYIDLGGRAADLCYALRAAADLLEGKEPEPLVTPGQLAIDGRDTNLVTPGAGLQRENVTNKSQAEIVEYFRKSPDLAPIADDVEATFKDQMSPADMIMQDVAAVLQQVPCSDLIDEQGNSRYGSQAKIAAALGIPNAGNYRPRILAVLQQIAVRTSTTNEQKPANSQKIAS